MASRTQIERLAQRIEALAPRAIATEPPFERWIVDGDKAYQLHDPEGVIPAAELAKCRTRKIVRVIVDPALGGCAA
jgi:hypothetical protein